MSIQHTLCAVIWDIEFLHSCKESLNCNGQTRGNIWTSRGTKIPKCNIFQETSDLWTCFVSKHFVKFQHSSTPLSQAFKELLKFFINFHKFSTQPWLLSSHCSPSKLVHTPSLGIRNLSCQLPLHSAKKGPVTSNSSLSFLIFFKLYWSRIGLQSCVFQVDSKVNQLHIHMHPFLFGFLDRLLHSSVCCTIDACYLSVLRIAVWICQSQFPNSSFPPPHISTLVAIIQKRYTHPSVHGSTIYNHRICLIFSGGAQARSPMHLLVHSCHVLCVVLGYKIIVTTFHPAEALVWLGSAYFLVNIVGSPASHRSGFQYLDAASSLLSLVCIVGQGLTNILFSSKRMFPQIDLLVAFPW